MSAETLAAVLDLKRVEYVRQLVQRGVLPEPVVIGEVERWDYEQVVEHLRGESGAGANRGEVVASPEDQHHAVHQIAAARRALRSPRA